MLIVYKKVVGRLVNPPQNGEDSEYAKTLLELQIRRSYHDMYTQQRCYEKSAEKNLRIDTLVKGIQLVTTALITGTFANVFFDKDAETTTTIFNIAANKVCAVVSAINLIAISSSTSYNFSSVAVKNKDTAHRLRKIREAYASLLTDYDTKEIDFIRSKRDQLEKQINEIYSNSLSTTTRDYAKAKLHIQERTDRHTFFNDNEDRIEELQSLLLLKNMSSISDRGSYRIRIKLKYPE